MILYPARAGEKRRESAKKEEEREDNRRGWSSLAGEAAPANPHLYGELWSASILLATAILLPSFLPPSAATFQVPRSPFSTVYISLPKHDVAAAVRIPRRRAMKLLPTPSTAESSEKEIHPCCSTNVLHPRGVATGVEANSRSCEVAENLLEESEVKGLLLLIEVTATIKPCRCLGALPKNYLIVSPWKRRSIAVSSHLLTTTIICFEPKLEPTCA